MIEIQTGRIYFPELDITVSPLMQRADFNSSFPKDKIIQIRDMKNGYIWYDIREKVYDNKILVQLCFNPQESLELVELYPQYLDLNAISNCESCSPKEVQKNKKYCDKWLVKFCGLKREENLFSWGSISACYDPRACSSSICIHYKARTD